jgi:LPS export ABC transporter protein LptC
MCANRHYYISSKKVIRNLKFVIAFFAFVSCQEKNDAKKNQELYTGPIIETDNLNVMHSDSGYAKIKMSTAKQLKYSNGNERYPKTVYVNFIDLNGAEYSRIRSDSAEYKKSDNLYVMRGNVLINNTRENQSLATEELFWNPNTRKIYSEKKVIIKTTKQNFTALEGMDADQDFTRYTLRKSRGTVVVDSIRTIVDTTGQ